MAVTSARGSLVAHLEAEVVRAGVAGQRVVVGLSGGADSVALLHALAELRETAPLTLSALHVHHGLSPNADAWAVFCENLCRWIAVPLRIERVQVSRSDARGVEAAARAERYRCYRAAEADVVALAHHADDQAETVMLQLLRGAGPAGLAAMPQVRSLASGKRLWRPLLGVRRVTIFEFLAQAGLRWVEDESNADPSYPRNFLRAEVLPRVETRFPAFRETLARAARNAAEAAELLETVADADIAACTVAGDTSDVLGLGPFLRLPLARQALVLRRWLERKGAAAPGRDALFEYLRQVGTITGDGRPELPVGQHLIVAERGRLLLLPAGMPALGWSVVWRGEAAVPLPDGRQLRFEAGLGTGLRAAALDGREVRISLRQGGERLRIAANRPSRTLKNLFQEYDVPPAERQRLPLVFVEGALALVPGIGCDPEFAAAPAEAGFGVHLIGPPDL